MICFIRLMFLTQRSAEPEYYDTPGLSIADRVAGFRELDRLNRVFRFTHPFTREIPRWLGREQCQNMTLLDVGAGTGFLGKEMTSWARHKGWDWQFTNLDFNPVVVQTPDTGISVTGSAMKLPFRDNSFDLVVASQMTHHLSDSEVIQHWREAWRVCRKGLFITDLHRNCGFYLMLWLSMTCLGIRPSLRADGLISVRRGFRCGEWENLARKADIPGAKVSLYYGTRILLQARKVGF